MKEHLFCVLMNTTLDVFHSPLSFPLTPSPKSFDLLIVHVAIRFRNIYFVPMSSPWGLAPRIPMYCLHPTRREKSNREELCPAVHVEKFQKSFSGLSTFTSSLFLSIFISLSPSISPSFLRSRSPDAAPSLKVQLQYIINHSCTLNCSMYQINQIGFNNGCRTRFCFCSSRKRDWITNDHPRHRQIGHWRYHD